MKSFQICVLSLVLGALGIGVVQSFVEKEKPVLVVSKGSSTQDEVHSLIGKLSLKEKETFYKMMKGIADYCENSRRIRDVHKVSDIIAEVYMNYKMETYTQLDDLIVRKTSEKGLNQDSLLKDSYEKVKDVFNDIADGVKYSIEKDKIGE